MFSTFKISVFTSIITEVYVKSLANVSRRNMKYLWFKGLLKEQVDMTGNWFRIKETRSL